MNLESLRGWMKGEDCVVVGCGPSAELAGRMEPETEIDNRWTIACNRAVEWSSPDFAVCIEPWFDKSWKAIRESSPLIVFSHIAENKGRWKKPHPRVMKLGRNKDVNEWLIGKPSENEEDRLRLGQSPFYAAAVAVVLGFETIGLIGVDLTEDRYPDPSHSNRAYGKLAAVAKTMGSRIINLNPDSRLTAVPSAGWEEIRTK